MIFTTSKSASLNTPNDLGLCVVADLRAIFCRNDKENRARSDLRTPLTPPLHIVCIVHSFILSEVIPFVDNLAESVVLTKIRIPITRQFSHFLLYSGEKCR